MPSVIELSDLDGPNGFVINGVKTGDASGYSVSNAGDVNGDGVDDIIIGAVYADPSNRTDAGAAYVVFGSSSGFAASLDLSALNGSNGFVMAGANASDYVGLSVSGAGDVNGDGIGDVIVGAPTDGPSGRSYVVFGSSAGFAASLELSALNGANGFALNGIDQYDYSGWSVSGAGDVNGDGVSDLIVGAWGADNLAGQSFVVFGKTGGFSASLELSALNGSNGFTLNGIAMNDESGVSVSGAGDINGDGIDDIIIGAVFGGVAGLGYTGASYVLFGKTGGFSANFNLASLNGSNGFAINGIADFDWAGFAVSGAGDVNGDGIDDIIIGGPSAKPGGRAYAGQSYVIFGNSAGFPSSLSLSSLNGANGFTINGIDVDDASGLSVSGAGDINGDGIGDLLIGAESADPEGRSYAGESYVIFGSSTGFAPTLELSSLNGVNGFALFGADPDDRSGFTVSAAGDVNNDGIDDLLVGAPAGDPGGRSFAGETYVLFGSTSFGLPDVPTGTAGPDTLIGSSASEAISGLGGNDSIQGAGGNDTLSGGAGDDTMDGGDGDDTMAGEAGRDLLRGGNDADTLHGFGSHDSLYGGNGDDDLRGGFGRDLLGGSGGNDVARGFEGDDRLFGGGGNDTLAGNDDNDELIGGGGTDRLKGDAGDDTLVGSFGSDSVTGGAGDDEFFFRKTHGADVFDDFTAGAGTDDYIRLVAFGAAFDTFAEVIAAASDNGTHTTINVGGGDQIILLGVVVGDLHADDFVFG